jgi:hypothetical protein
MKAIKTLNAVVAASLLTGATLAQAATYEVTGTLDSFSSNPDVISAIFNPTAPAFTGSWDVTTSALSGAASFSPYSVEWSVAGFGAVGTTSYTADNYSLASTTSAYDAVTRTLTVNGTVANTSVAYTCSGSAFFCGDTLPAFDLTLTLTFTDDTLKAFNGSLVATNSDGEGSQYDYAWSFNGQTPEVPVPAAFWLFGSGLAGLAGFARSRKS